MKLNKKILKELIKEAILEKRNNSMILEEPKKEKTEKKSS